MAYEPPFEVFINEMTSQLIKAEEDAVACEVSRQIGVQVNREEMIKCLNYDRGQYERGYRDGYEAGRVEATNPPFPIEAFRAVKRFCEEYAGCRDCPMEANCGSERRPFTWDLPEDEGIERSEE